jgi:hypothetical protein
MSSPRRLLFCSACVTWLVSSCGNPGIHASKGSPSDASDDPPGAGDAAAPGPDLPPTSADHGRPLMDPTDLVNLLSPLAWLAGGGGTTFYTSSPCGDEGCSDNTSGLLCARGHIAALACTGPDSCDWDSNWGAMIGLNLSPLPRQPWGSSAAAGIAVTFAGGPGEYRLTAHVAGDPDGRVYCVDNCPSGQLVEPNAFLTECWDNAGDVLSSFTVIDQLGLQIISAQEPIDFDFCISGFAVY